MWPLVSTQRPCVIPDPSYTVTDRQEVGSRETGKGPEGHKPKLRPRLAFASPPSTLLVLHLPRDNYKHRDQVYFHWFYPQAPTLWKHRLPPKESAKLDATSLTVHPKFSSDPLGTPVKQNMFNILYYTSLTFEEFINKIWVFTYHNDSWLFACTSSFWCELQ